MLVGGKHGAQLTVSLWSLRNHWDGPVALIVGNEPAREVCSKLVDDPRSGDCQLVEWDAPTGGGKGLQHCNKTRILELTPFDDFVFLDCDTLVVGEVDGLFPRAGTEEVVLSQFADWWSDWRKIQKRTEPYREIMPMEVARSQGVKHPAINTGTFGMSKRSTAYVKKWRAMAERQPRFMCDEIVAQLIFCDYPHRVLDARWNCSPIFCYHQYGPTSGRMGEVKVWHGHGWKFIKRRQGNEIWLPYYREAVRHNFGQLADWTPGDDKRLQQLLMSE